MGGSGGIGLFEIILLAGIGYLLYRFIKKKREDRSSSPYNRH
jgi:threonine/homoserine/homoserine lactone efflux protein